MALISTFTKFGTAFSNAYTRIQSVEYANSKDESWELSEDPTVPPTRVFNKMLKVAFVANTYSSSAATDEELLNSKQHLITLTDASDVIGSCYAHLKTLSEFTGAQDA